jgi:hypothetical protein
MTKKNEVIDGENLEYITTELEKMHPEQGDIFILNVNTDDPDLLYSDEILDSVDKLAETLFEFTGIKIPILVFGDEIDLSVMSKDELKELIARLEDMEQDLEDQEEDDDNLDSEGLTTQFN